MSLPVSAPVAFEKLQININSIDIHKVQELQGDEGLAKASVFHTLSVVTTPECKELVGDISIVFRNKEAQDGGVLLLKGFFTVNADAGDDTSDTFYSLLRYLFIYTKEFIAEKNIQGKNGNPFIIPDCDFSKSKSGMLTI